jgi:hypothetical protein
MSYELKVLQKPAYLHFVVTGWNNKNNVLKYFEEVSRECGTRNCFRVLIEERLDGSRLSIMDRFEWAVQITDKYRGFFRVIAYVDVNAVEDSMKFTEDACVNRGLFLTVFSAVSKAESWLSQYIPGENI